MKLEECTQLKPVSRGGKSARKTTQQHSLTAIYVLSMVKRVPYYFHFKLKVGVKFWKSRVNHAVTPRQTLQFKVRLKLLTCFCRGYEHVKQIDLNDNFAGEYCARHPKAFHVVLPLTLQKDQS